MSQLSLTQLRQTWIVSLGNGNITFQDVLLGTMLVWHCIRLSEYYSIKLFLLYVYIFRGKLLALGRRSIRAYSFNIPYFVPVVLFKGEPGS